MFYIRRVNCPAQHADLNDRTAESWEWLATPPDCWWVAEDVNFMPVGYAGMRLHAEDTVYMGPTFVDECARGHGLQRRFLKAREKVARRMGFAKSVSVTDPGNLPSANNLIRCGYRLVPPWRDDWPECLYWEKVLNGRK